MISDPKIGTRVRLTVRTPPLHVGSRGTIVSVDRTGFEVEFRDQIRVRFDRITASLGLQQLPDGPADPQ